MDPNHLSVLEARRDLEELRAVKIDQRLTENDWLLDDDLKPKRGGIHATRLARKYRKKRLQVRRLDAAIEYYKVRLAAAKAKQEAEAAEEAYVPEHHDDEN